MTKMRYTTFEVQDEAQRAASESTDNFLRKVQENSIKRLLQTSPECINVEDETQIRQLKELYSDRRTGEQPPPPSPDEISAPDLLRKGLSWQIPAFKRAYASESVRAQPSLPRSSFGQGFGEDETIFHSTAIHQMKGTDSKPCQPCQPASPSKLEYVKPSAARFSESHEFPGTSRRPSPCRSREVSPSQPSGRRVSTNSRLSTSGNKQRSPAQLGPCFSRDDERESPPVGLWAGSRSECSPAEGKSAFNDSPDPLDLSNVQELDFTDQFLLPTANVEFDEETQDRANTYFTDYDDADDNWMAPPEISPDATYNVSLPPIAKCSPKEEQFDRREGRLFIPAEKTEYASDEIETIDWPESENLYDINVDFDEDEPPFEYLERGSPCEEEFPQCSSYDEEEDDEVQMMRWQSLRHVADQLGDWHFKS